MITDQDRSGWIGASDVGYVIGNWKTKTWEKWWMQKLGINRDHFDNRYTMAGTNWEHRILESLNIPDLEMDRQFFIEELRLRVNLDGNTPFKIKEVKTYQYAKGFRCPQKYKNQVQVQMFASKIFRADIVAYGLTEEDYDNYFREVDRKRIQEIPVEWDPVWVNSVWLPRQMILAECLKKGVFPDDRAVG